MCNRVLLLNQGQLKYDGKLVDLVNQNKKCKLIKVKFNEKACTDLKFIESLKQIDGVLHIDIQQDYITLRINHNEMIPLIIGILHKYNIHDLNVQNEDLIDIINNVIKDSHSN